MYVVVVVCAFVFVFARVRARGRCVGELGVDIVWVNVSARMVW